MAVASATGGTAAPAKRQGLRERKKREVRGAILAAGEALFRTKGYTATSMDDIAAAANISRKTLFNYLNSKDTIVLALIDALIERNLSDWEESDLPYYHDARDVGTPTWKQRLGSIGSTRWLLVIAAKHTRYFSGDATKYASEIYRRNARARKRRIAAVQAEGRMRSDISAEEISNYYDAMRDLVLRTWLLKPRATRTELYRNFEHAMSVLVQGLAPPAAVPAVRLPPREK